MIRVLFSLLLMAHLKSQSGDSEVKVLSIDVRGNSITSKQTITEQDLSYLGLTLILDMRTSKNAKSELRAFWN